MGWCLLFQSRVGGLELCLAGGGIAILGGAKWVFVRVSLVMVISRLRVYFSCGWGCVGVWGSRCGGGLFVCWVGFV